jgi:hypothetical protein
VNRKDEALGRQSHSARPAVAPYQMAIQTNIAKEVISC